MMSKISSITILVNRILTGNNRNENSEKKRNLIILAIFQINMGELMAFKIIKKLMAKIL